MKSFKSSAERSTGAYIVENGVSNEIITLDPLYLADNISMPYCMSQSECATLCTELAADSTYSGYHLMTLAEALALKAATGKNYDENPWPDSTLRAGQYWYWKPAEEMPFGLDGPTYCRQKLGIKFDGSMWSETNADGTVTLSEVGVGLTNKFWLSDNMGASMVKTLLVSKNGGIFDSTTWGPMLTQGLHSILLVKNRQ